MLVRGQSVTCVFALHAPVSSSAAILPAPRRQPPNQWILRCRCLRVTHPMPSAVPKAINFAWARTQSLQFCQKQQILHGHTSNAFSSAKSNKFCMGTHPMPSVLPKGINFAWAHTQCLQLCQKQLNLHGHTPNAFSSAKSNKFCMGTHPMPSVLPKVINFAWANTKCLQFCKRNKFCMGTHPMPSVLPKAINFAWVHTQCLQFCQKQYILHGNPPPKSAKKSQQIGEQIGGPIFQQNSFPVPWILVRGSKHTFIYFGTLDNTFSFYMGCSDWHHEVFLLPTKRRVCGPLRFIVPR